MSLTQKSIIRFFPTTLTNACPQAKTTFFEEVVNPAEIASFAIRSTCGIVIHENFFLCFSDIHERLADFSVNKMLYRNRIFLVLSHDSKKLN